MAYTTINKSTDYFNTKLYTGNGTTNTAITGVGFQPDLSIIKARDMAYNNNVMDAVRGSTKRVATDLSDAESTQAEMIKSFASDGFNLGDNGGVNQNTKTYVAWNWKAGGGQGSSNTDGSINTTYTSVNTTAGFSISKYVGTGSNATVGHGLGVAPKVVITKNLDTADNWTVYHESLGNTKGAFLNLTNAPGTSSAYWNNTTPTSSVFSVGTEVPMNKSGDDIIAYCFAEKTGYSKFGKLISNGSDDGTFTYTGFAPKWVMLKPTVSDGWSNWYIFDTTRDTNLNDKPLYANLSTQEAYYGGSPATNYAQIDMLSNGFKIRRDGNWGGGGNGTELIYMAFGQSIVGSNNIPATAR